MSIVDTRLRCRCCTRGYVGPDDWRERCEERASGEDQLCDKCREFLAQEPFRGWEGYPVRGVTIGHNGDYGWPLSRHELLPFGSPHDRPQLAGWGVSA